MSTMSIIVKLMKQADNAEKIGNLKEAQSYREKAIDMANKVQCDESDIRSQMSEEEKKDTMVVETISVGEKGTVGLRSRANWVAIISCKILNVNMDLRHNGTGVVAYGSGSQVEEAKNLVASLLDQNTDYIPQARKEVKDQGQRFSRIHYDDGFFFELYDLAGKMYDARQDYIKSNLPEETVSEDNYTVAQSQAISLRNTELEVQDFYQSASTARGSFRSSSSRVQGGDYSRDAGHKAGKSANLSGQRSISA